MYAPYASQTALQSTHPTNFYTHHYLKVIPKDAVRADVERDGAYFHLIEQYPPSSIWCEVTNACGIEQLIVCRNKHHLQQVTVDEGHIHDPIMQTLIAYQGCNDLVKQLLKGELSLTEVTDEAI